MAPADPKRLAAKVKVDTAKGKIFTLKLQRKGLI